jgi:hypothetical protein
MSTREERFAKKYAEAVNHVDFDAAAFAHYLDRESPHVQAMAVLTGMAVIENIAEQVNRGATNDPEWNVAINLATQLGIL